MAAPGDLPENHALASAIARGTEKRAIVSAADAEAYAARITTATYGAAQAQTQLPFRAEAEGPRWRVVGSRAMDLGTLTGPLTIVVRREDGKVEEIMFTAAPVGWDAGLKKP